METQIDIVDDGPTEDNVFDSRPELDDKAFVKLVSNDGCEFIASVKVLSQSPILAKMLDGRFKESEAVFKLEQDL